MEAEIFMELFPATDGKPPVGSRFFAVKINNRKELVYDYYIISPSEHGDYYGKVLTVNVTRKERVLQPDYSMFAETIGGILPGYAYFEELKVEQIMSVWETVHKYRELVS